MSDQPSSFRAQEDIQPPYDDPARCPGQLNKTRAVDGVTYVAAREPVDGSTPEIMFVGTAIQEEEAATEISYTHGVRLRQKPEYLKGATGMIIDVAARAGIDIEKQAYTCLVKWLLPRTQRNRPSRQIMDWGMPILEAEIEKFKPKIIVCMGKPVFDMLSDIKIKFDDATGGWFWSERYNAHLYVMQPPYMLVAKPDMYEVFRIDFQEIAYKLSLLNLGDQQREEPKGIILDDLEALEEWVAKMSEEDKPLFTVDCEWHGDTHVDGLLRSIQFGYSETEAVYIRFMDDQLNYTFMGADYKKVGKVLSRHMGKPHVKYVGHHYAADAPWMQHVLGMKVYGKCVLDTEFAQQTLDASSELGLERGIAMRYTTLGLYNLDLVLWKKQNKELCEHGYGYIPDSILIPYAIKDVIAPFRAYSQMRKLLEMQGLTAYYDNIFNPFVTDVFTQFAIAGLPVDVELMTELQEVYHFVRRRLEIEFKVKSLEFAKKLMLRYALETKTDLRAVSAAIGLVTKGNIEAARNEINSVAPAKTISKWGKLIDYLIVSPDFNIRSPDHLRLWLFDACGLTPVKSTNKKTVGLPSMAWDKVLEMPTDRQALYTPAVDKQTLAILQPECALIDDLLDLNVVGNLCKAFLKEPDEYINDEGEVELVKKGLHQWVASDSKIHCQYSATGTARPRTWRPNTLNWPSYVTARIAKTVLRALKSGADDPTFPDIAKKYLDFKSEKEMKSIRSIVTAAPGWCMVESDYRTAELVGLSIISGDKDLQRILFEPDPEWALLVDDPIRNPQGIKAVRVAWADTKVTGIAQRNQLDKYLLAAWEGDKVIAQFTADDLMRDENGNVKHTSYDIHWSLVEMAYERPREQMQAKVERQSGKVANFCVAEGSMVLTDRLGWAAIEAVRDTDLVWDGDAWVAHDGVVFSGEREVWFYQGLWATPEHEVWVSDGRKMRLQDVTRGGLTLVRPTLPDGVRHRQWSSLLGANDSRVARTYDIMNAGPMNRFTCQGVLVSNSSAYGATGSTLDRKIEADTGNKPEEGNGERLLEAIRKRQPRATEFLEEEMARLPMTKKFYRAASGRLARCVTHSRDSGVNWRLRNSIESALGREMRNFPMQESVGSTAARAGCWLNDIYEKLGMQARVMTILYDSCVTLCPLEERHVVSYLHECFMSQVNTWDYEDKHGKRTLQYTIDTDFNYRWSTKPTKVEAAQLRDTSWHPTPARWAWVPKIKAEKLKQKFIDAV